MKFDEAKNTGIAVATASILNEVKLQINRNITVNYKCNSYNSYVGIWFHQGVFLNDPHQLLEQSNEKTKGLRKMTFSSKEEIIKHKSIIEDYIEEAIINASKGKEITTVRNKEIIIPSLLQQEFIANPELSAAFKKLTPGQQRLYCDYISSAKQEKTKSKRLKNIIPLILLGKGLHDKYK